MSAPKLSIVLLAVSLLFSCQADLSEDFQLKSNAANKSITNDQTLELSIDNPKNHAIDSTVYAIDGTRVGNSVALEAYKLGHRLLEAKVYINGQTYSLSQEITLLNNTLPKIFDFKILNVYPHDITSYTQGLEFFNGELYESTGQKGESKLRKVDYRTGAVLKNIDLEARYFGEGLTIMGDKIHQLTWQAGVGFTYDLNSFERLSTFNYDRSREGWGLCNDGNAIYKSDGTEKIWLLDPETLAEKEFIQAFHNKGKVVGLNELEWIDGRIYANRYQLNGVAIINPENGAIEGVIDFSSLREQVTQHPKLDVLNGIAYNPETKTLFVTGKYWDKLFEVEILEK